MTTTGKNYFADCQTLDEAKTLFRKLVFKLHPDYNNGEDQEFIKIYAQFEKFKPAKPLKENEDFSAQAFYNIIRKFDGLSNVLITFVGSFIWLEDEPNNEGATKAQKEVIKSILLDGYNSPRFSPNHIKWYYSPEGYKQKFKSRKSFDEIRSTWGSKTYSPKQYRDKEAESQQVTA